MDRPSEGHEQQIAQWIRQGEPHGFTLLLEQYGPRVAGSLRQRFPSLDDHDLHDVLADAMLAVANSFDARRGPLSAWFLLLAQQRAMHRLRTREAGPRWESWAEGGEPVDADATPLDKLVTRERLGEVERIIVSLSSLEQAVVRADLDAGRSMPADELATRLETTSGSVYAARQRARRKLLARCPWISEMLGEKGAADDQTA
jgi:RNA polymerase sigma factor (sigma-70 family)